MDKYYLILVLFTLPTLLPPLRNIWFMVHLVIVAGGMWLLDNKVHPSDLIFIISFFTLHLVSINIITFLLYWLDKRASVRGAWRIPEKKLHAYAFVGGTPAAYFASKILRHKTVKRSFRMNFIIIVVLQVIVFIGAIFAAIHFFNV